MNTTTGTSIYSADVQPPDKKVDKPSHKAPNHCQMYDRMENRSTTMTAPSQHTDTADFYRRRSTDVDNYM